MALKFNEHGYPYEDRGHLDLTLQIERLQKEIKLLRQNRSLDTMDEVAYRELQAENKKLKKRAQEAEGELTIIKGIGNTSPEMNRLQQENEELKAALARAKEDHQYDNLVHQKELEKILKKF